MGINHALFSILVAMPSKRNFFEVRVFQDHLDGKDLSHGFHVLDVLKRVG